MAVLFGKIKAGDARNQILEMFRHVVKETQSPTGYAVVPKAFAEKAANAEPTLLQINQAVAPDAAGNVQVRATAEGIAALAVSLTNATGSGGTTAPAVSPETKPSFTLNDGIPVPPPSQRGGLRSSIYPFDSMAVGQSFFIAATDDNPNPAKAMGSTISSANKRFASVYPATTGKNKTPHPKAGQPTGKDGRKFTVRPRTVADGEKSNGARIWRIS